MQCTLFRRRRQWSLVLRSCTGCECQQLHAHQQRGLHRSVESASFSRVWILLVHIIESLVCGCLQTSFHGPVAGSRRLVPPQNGIKALHTTSEREIIALLLHFTCYKLHTAYYTAMHSMELGYVSLHYVLCIQWVFRQISMHVGLHVGM